MSLLVVMGSGGTAPTMVTIHRQVLTEDPRDVVRPYVDLLLEVRGPARAAKDYGASDLVRDRLAAAGVEVRDTPDGADWLLTNDGGRVTTGITVDTLPVLSSPLSVGATSPGDSRGGSRRREAAGSGGN